MRIARFSPIVFVAALMQAACGSDSPTTPPGSTLDFQIRVVNANTAPVDLLVDGVVSLSSVRPGSVVGVSPAPGAHTIGLRESGSATTVSAQLNVVANVPRTFAAMRSGASLSVELLDDTNAVVQPGKTKVRVLHLAPNAGEITVMRTQPDYGTPISWQFPFLYSATISAIGNPYFESTVGTWDVRAWRKPSEDALGWSGTAARVTLTLASGEKRTVLVLDKAGGGITLSVIE